MKAWSHSGSLDAATGFLCYRSSQKLGALPKEHTQVRQPLGPRMLHPRELSGWGGLGLGVLTVELPAGPGLHPPDPGNLDRW